MKTAREFLISKIGFYNSAHPMTDFDGEDVEKWLDEYASQVKPELPTDEEIISEALIVSNKLFPEKERHERTANHYDGFIEGAKWLLDKMQNLKGLNENRACISCDEKKPLHEICFECIAQMIKENQPMVGEELKILKATHKRLLKATPTSFKNKPNAPNT